MAAKLASGTVKGLGGASSSTDPHISLRLLEIRSCLPEPALTVRIECLNLTSDQVQLVSTLVQQFPGLPWIRIAHLLGVSGNSLGQPELMWSQADSGPERGCQMAMTCKACLQRDSGYVPISFGKQPSGATEPLLDNVLCGRVAEGSGEGH